MEQVHCFISGSLRSIYQAAALASLQLGGGANSLGIAIQSQPIVRGMSQRSGRRPTSAGKISGETLKAQSLPYNTCKRPNLRT
ncbi:hypothetical protein BDW71DRAFT_170236 [Aspergillus fruticulosus]